MAIAGGVIGSLQVNIVATTDKFYKGLTNAKSQLDKFVGSIATVSNAIELLGARAFVDFIRGAIEAGSHLFGLTKKLHISAEGISALHFAAEQLGTSTEVVDNAIFKMTKTLGGAIQGSKESATAFGMLGINAKALSQLPVQQQFLEIVDALHKIPDPAKRAALAQGIFGKASGELAILIDHGTDEIIKQSKEAAKAGAIIGGDTTKSLDEADSAIKKFTSTMEALKIKLVGDFAPEIGKALGGANFLLKGMVTQLETVAITAEFVVEQILKSFKRLGQGLNFFLPKSLQIDLSGLQSAIDEVSTQRQSLIKDITAPSQENPLQKPSASITNRDATRAADGIDQIVALMQQTLQHQQQQAQQKQTLGQPQIALAGVR
jgi:hypothetical protein